MPLDMNKLPPSPFADQPYDVKVENTKALVEQWLKDNKHLKDNKDNADETTEGTPTEPKARPWYRGNIGGVPITVILRFIYTSTMDAMRTNRYRLPAKFYIILWMALWVSAVSLPIVGLFEAMEAAIDSKAHGSAVNAPKCGPVHTGPFYRITARSMFGSLPLLVTMTIFFFPALVRP